MTIFYLIKRFFKTFLLILFLILLHNLVCAQHPAELSSFTIQPHRLSLAYMKTTNLVFPYAIKSVDLGSNDVLAQKARSVENILQIKAGKENFPETNLTVITADGKLYSFLLNYDANPKELNLVLENQEDIPAASLLSEYPNPLEIKRFSAVMATRTSSFREMKEKSGDFHFGLNAIFIEQDVLYFRMTFKNGSNIKYDIDQLRFYIQDSNKTKRTASQEIELQPVYMEQGFTSIDAKTQLTLVVALMKFTIPDQKQLVIQLLEKNGGRHLELKVKNKTLIKVGAMPNNRLDNLLLNLTEWNM